MVIKELLKSDIDSIYQLELTLFETPYSKGDYEYLILKEKFGNTLKLICVCCDKKIRYERIGKREDRPFNKEQILDRDLTEIENLAKGGPIAFADYYIFNNGNLDEYITRLNEIITDIEETEGEK